MIIHFVRSRPHERTSRSTKTTARTHTQNSTTSQIMAQGQALPLRLLLTIITLALGLHVSRAADTAPICAGLPSDTRFDNPARCSAFWVCVEGLTVAATCPPALPNFDPSLLDCVSAEQFECVDGGEQPTATTTELVTTEVTAEATASQQTTTEVTAEATASEERTTETTTTEEEPLPSSTITTGTTEITTTEQPPIETACVGRPNGYFANDPRSCAAYFWCHNGIARPQECIDGLPFNEPEQLCDWQLVCDDEPPAETTPAPPTVLPPTLAERCALLPNGHFLNNPVRCTAYFVCWNNEVLTGDCVDSLAFNEDEQLCDWMLDCVDEATTTTTPSDVPTTTEQVTTTDGTTAGETTTDETTAEQTTRETTEATEEGTTDETAQGTTEHTTQGTTEATADGSTEPDETTEGPTEHTTHATTEEESQETTEAETTAPTEETTQSTPEETTQGTTEGTTEAIPEETTTEQTTADATEATTTEEPTETTAIPTTTTESSPAIECPSDGIHQFPKPGSCVSYFQCVNGQLGQRECPAGMHFDANIYACNLIEDAACTRDLCPEVDDPENLKYFPSTLDCRAFYKCERGDLVGLQCPPGLHWNQAIRNCDSPANVECKI